MKKFLGRFFFSFLPILAFLVIIELLVRDAQNDYKYKWSYLNGNAKDLEVLVLGNSQSFYGIDCNSLSARSFNMAMEGQGLLIDDYILEHFGSALVDLRAVVLPISYLSLTQPAAFGAPGRITQYHLYYGYESKWFSTENYECLSPLSCREKIKFLISGNSLRQVDSLGCCSKPTGTFRNDADETLSWTTGGTEKIIDFNKAALTHISGQCEKKGIKLILISFPTDASYRSSCYYDSSQMERVKGFAAMLSNNSKSTIWIDWSESDEFDHSDFFDSSHLNSQGASKLSTMVNTTLKEIGVL